MGEDADVKFGCGCGCGCGCHLFDRKVIFKIYLTTIFIGIVNLLIVVGVLVGIYTNMLTIQNMPPKVFFGKKIEGKLEYRASDEEKPNKTINIKYIKIAFYKF